ncbi:hypothetical protein PMAYCL1PPCAC_28351, partial [Pristionchus mayeri]
QAVTLNLVTCCPPFSQYASPSITSTAKSPWLVNSLANFSHDSCFCPNIFDDELPLSRTMISFAVTVRSRKNFPEVFFSNFCAEITTFSMLCLLVILTILFLISLLQFFLEMKRFVTGTSPSCLRTKSMVCRLIFSRRNCVID